MLLVCLVRDHFLYMILLCKRKRAQSVTKQHAMYALIIKLQFLLLIYIDLFPQKCNYVDANKITNSNYYYDALKKNFNGSSFKMNQFYDKFTIGGDNL